ncbi:MAG: Nre family DNA repair protein [Thermoplasmata archaeon]
MPELPPVDGRFASPFQKDWSGDRLSSQCSICKGSKLLCGKISCPLLLRYYSGMKTRAMIDREEIDGSSPPAVFVGRFGYPKVLIGPMIPPEHGDTEVLDTPEMWIGKPLEEIVDYRYKLVRGTFQANIHDIDSAGRLVELTRELAMASRPADIEAHFTKRPVGGISFHEESQPFGPSAPLRKISVSSIKLDNRIDKVASDTDLKAKEAILELYKSGTLISRIQKAFSVGAFGEKKRRKFVPTRWSITAVDSTIGLELLKTIKNSPIINEYRIYFGNFLDNRWAVIFLPTSWRYELIEAWYPKTIWNPYGSQIEMVNSWEFFDGRRTYAEIGGCYYAARMAVGELLERERRQAGVVILREAHPGYVLPIGVWNVREHVRRTLKNPPKKYSTFKDVMLDVSNFMDIPVSRWMKTSAVLKDLVEQRRIDDFADTRRLG